jgi:hypothetical protein
MGNKYSEDDYRLRVELPSEFPDDVKVVLNIPKQKDVKKVIKKVDVVLTSEEKLAAGKIPLPITPFRAFTYFKVKDSGNKVITSFDPPLIIEISYSNQAWFYSEGCITTDKEYYPRVYYLEKTKKGWDHWKKFPDDESVFFYRAPEERDGKSLGYIQITVSDLEDPRIGGC